MAGLGVSFLANPTAARRSQPATCSLSPLAPEAMWRLLGLIYRKDKALSKAASGFHSSRARRNVGSGEGVSEKTLAPRVVGLMTCPHCRKEFTQQRRHVSALRRAERRGFGRIPTSTVLISTDGADHVQPLGGRSRLRICAAA